MYKRKIEILLVQEAHINTNFMENKEGYAFICSTGISNKDREEMENHRNSGLRKGRGKGKGHIVGHIVISRRWNGLSCQRLCALSNFEQFDGRTMTADILIKLHKPMCVINCYAPQSKYSLDTKATYVGLENVYRNRRRDIH